MKAVARYPVDHFTPRTWHALSASKILPFIACDVIICENLKALIFRMGTKHSLGVKITPWNLFRTCLCLRRISQNLRIGNNNIKVNSLIVR